MTHRDSLGNEDTIGDGEVQWMTAGSGILHEEMLPESERLLGVQLWLNLPEKDKMTTPAYKSIKKDAINEVSFEHGMVRVLAGKYKDVQGFVSKYLPLDFYDIHLQSGGTLVVDTAQDRSVMLFTLSGEAYIAGELVEEKTAVKLTSGDSVHIQAKDRDAQVLCIGSEFLGEAIAWGGPIVMNTKEALQKAFDELEQGTFLHKKIAY
jgi:redox-sensitive bicupin YhaK (pirin superfamily)